MHVTCYVHIHKVHENKIKDNLGAKISEICALGAGIMMFIENAYYEF